MPQNARLNPALVDTHLCSTSWLQDDANEANLDGPAAELSLLCMAPPFAESSGKKTSPGLIIMVRSRISGEDSYQLAHSILDRWEIVEQARSMHPAFEQLGNRRSGVTSDLPSSHRLRKLEPMMVDKVIIKVQMIQCGKVVMLAFADGSVAYRDRWTLEEIYQTEDLSRVGNLRQAGWTFTGDGPCS